MFSFIKRLHEFADNRLKQEAHDLKILDKMRNIFLTILLFFSTLSVTSQVINTDKVMLIGRNAIYYEDYVLAIQYFNQVIKAKPYLAEPYYFRAVAKFLLEDFQGAEEDCTECLKINPFITNAYYLRGDARLSLEKFQGAIEDYEKSLNTMPENKLALINLGVANIRNKSYDDAEIVLDKLIDLYPTYPQAYLTRGSLYLEEGDSIKALSDYTEAIKQDSSLYQSYSMRGLLNYQLKNYDNALVDLDEAIRLDPLYSGNYINRGLVKYAKDDYRGAMADYDQVIGLDSINVIGRINRGLLRAQVGDDRNAATDFDVALRYEPGNNIVHLNRALVRSNYHDYAGAIADMDLVLGEYSDFFQGFYIRSELKTKIGDRVGAARDLAYARAEEARISKAILAGKEPEKRNNNKTREISDKSIDKFNLLVVADKADEEKNKYNSNTRGRIQTKQVTLDLHPLFVLTYYAKVNEVKSDVNYNAAITDINKLNILPSLLRITNEEAALTEDQIEKHFASLNDYSKLIDDNKEDALLYFARSVDYLLVQDLNNAVADLNKATVINPRFTLALFNLGAIYAKEFELDDKNKGALSVQTKSTPVSNENSAAGISNMPSGLVSLPEKAEYNLAIKCFDKVLEIDPSFTFAYYNRASLKAMKGRYNDAIQDYTVAIDIDRSFSEAYFNRGICRLYAGDKEKGLADLRKAGELGVTSAYAIIKRLSDK